MQIFAWAARCARPGGLLAVIALLLCSGPGSEARQTGQSQTQPPAPAKQTLPPSSSARAPEAPPAEGPQSLHVTVGRSLVITSPVRIKRVSLADPNIAEAIVISPYQLQVNGKTPGAVSLLLWDENDQNQAFDVYVDLDILGVSQKIREVFPAEPVQIEASKDLLMLSGRVSSKAVADKIYEVVSSTAPKVISLMEVPVPPSAGEILLQVKFAEVDRTALSQVGFNFFSPGTGFGPRSTIGSLSTQQFAAPSVNSLSTDVTPGGTTVKTDFNFSDLLNLFVFRTDIDLGVTIRALQQQNLLQILAEPNLLTENGKEASFLAGGEFPFPIVQPSQTFTSITIQFKEFGVRLNFKPTITEDGKIHLRVRPEVSALDFSNALRISGFLIPALSTRRVESEMELEDGQSFAIAGLVDDRVTRSLAKVPWIGDIPILGHLFRSRSLNKSKTELLVLVTPHVVKPSDFAKPAKEPGFPVPLLPPASPEPAKPPLGK